MGCFADCVLLERTVDGVATEEGVRAVGFVAEEAELAGSAGSVEPFEADVVSDFDVSDF